MKFEVEVVRFDVSDIVTTSTCANPALPTPIGDAAPTCPSGFMA